jgi:hypothetical protein
MNMGDRDELEVRESERERGVGGNEYFQGNYELTTFQFIY